MSKNIAISEPILAQARTWYVRMGDEQAGGDDWALFTAWLEENPVNVDAYDQVEMALADVASVVEAQENITQNNENNENNENNVVQLIAKPKKPPKIIWGRLASIAALFIATLTVFYINNQFQPASVQTYATNVGGHEEIVLKDGTRINLNTNTQISVAINDRTRIVTLKGGEAFFDIAKDEKRPFIVNAMDTKITDIGTSFSVYATDVALMVSVADGIVDIHNNSQTTRLLKGQEAVQMLGFDDIAVRAVDIENISTWRDGVLVFDNVALSTIVPELNRYFKIPISLKDEVVANLTFSGVINISDQNTMLGSMEALLPIKSDFANGQILLYHKN